MQSLDLRALEIFRTVALEGSVSRAASRLNRVQSNISTRIRQLEEHVGKPLFLRGRRGLTLTPEGDLLLSYAERLLELSTQASEALSNGRPSGTFRIGTMESTAAVRLPDILSRYHELYPEVQIELDTDTAAGLIRRLLNHEIEAAFIAEPVSMERIDTRPVFEERLMLVAPKSFPELTDTAGLSGRTVLAFEQGCAYRRYLEDWLLQEGIVPGAVLSVGSYLAMLACVSAGTGYAVVPQSVLEMIAGEGQFRRRPLPGKASRIRTLLAWRSGHSSAKLTALNDLLPGRQS